MASITVCRHQRAGARAFLDQAIRDADSPSWSAKRDDHREWLSTPSETLRMVCGQAGFSPFPGAWFRYLGERLARWQAESRVR